VVALTVLAMVVLLAASALVIDVGAWERTKAQAQSAADAAALATAADLPDTGAVDDDLSASRSQNGWQGLLQATVRSVNAANDTVSVVARTQSPSVFARVLGIGSVTIGARATAQLGSYTGWATNLAPWAIARQDLAFGQRLDLKVAPGDQYAPGNFGAINLVVPGNAACVEANGANDYGNLIENAVQSCLISIGDVLDLKTGNMANLETSLQARGAINGLDPSMLLTTGPDGQPALRKLLDPNLVVIPIIDQFVNGSHPVTVVDFAYFIITSYTKTNVQGMFVRAGAPSGMTCPATPNGDQPCPVGAYDPNGIHVIRLIA
jgi:hypothetical protein